jgi:hypothetical protein
VNKKATLKIFPSFPKKNIFTNKNEVTKRKKDLEEYLNIIIKLVSISHIMTFLSFEKTNIFLNLPIKFLDSNLKNIKNRMKLNIHNLKNEKSEEKEIILKNKILIDILNDEYEKMCMKNEEYIIIYNTKFSKILFHNLKIIVYTPGKPSFLSNH